uniref:Uncharacterized protein n=1 Tax=Lygus hesperus TaxID=30085 RepID=A0A0A9WQJ1_LYGHE
MTTATTNVVCSDTNKTTETCPIVCATTTSPCTVTSSCAATTTAAAASDAVTTANNVCTALVPTTVTTYTVNSNGDKRHVRVVENNNANDNNSNNCYGNITTSSNVKGKVTGLFSQLYSYFVNNLNGVKTTSSIANTPAAATFEGLPSIAAVLN